MGLFDRFRKKDADDNNRKQDSGMEFRKQNPVDTGGLGYPAPMENRFWQLYAESLQLKDKAMLRSALDRREEALRSACPDRGYEGMALHNLAILSMYHLGKGKDAMDYALRSLDCGEAYLRCSKEHMAELQFGAHLESVQTAMMTASSYDEALEYCAQGEKLYGGVFEQKRKEIGEFRKEHPRYVHYQIATSQLYYSRVSPEMDQGDYAPGMSLLMLMLDRAEKPGYDLSYEEYVDILDDYTTITAMYLMKKARVLNGPPDLFARELAFIADEPLRHLAEFMPDCQPGDREKFERIIAAFRLFPGITDRDAFAPFR